MTPEVETTLAQTTSTERKPVAEAPAATARRELSPADGVTLVGRCLDHDGKPLADVTALGNVYELNGDGRTDTRSTASGTNGRFELTLPTRKDHGHELVLRLAGHCDVSGTFFNAKQQDRIDVGDVVIPTACTVTGTVVDKDGMPQAGVQLSLAHLTTNLQAMRPDAAYRKATTGTDGRFELDGIVPPGDYELWPKNRLELDASQKKFTIVPHQDRCIVDLKVDTAVPKCVGIVVDDNGAPVVGAGIMLEGGRTSPSTTTDVNGHFTIEPDPHREQPYRVEASGDIYRSAKVAWDPEQTEPVRIELTRKPGLQLRVIDAATKRPVTSYVAWLLRPTSQGNVPTIRTKEHPGGRAFAASQPGDYFVVVQPTDQRYGDSASVPVTVPEVGVTELTVALAAPHTRRLVVMQGGKPVPNASVQLVDCGGKPATLTTEIWPIGKCRVHGEQIGCQLQSGTTDEHGVLRLTGPSGPLSLRIQGAGLARQVVQPIRLEQSGDLVVQAKRGAVLTGRVKPSKVARRLWQRIQRVAHTSSSRNGLQIRHPAGPRMDSISTPSCAVGEDGSFRIEGIPPGTWDVAMFGAQRYTLARITFAEGQLVEQVLDASALLQVATTFRFVLDGNPITAEIQGYGVHTADVRGDRFNSRPRFKPDATGRTTIDTWPGEILLQVPIEDATGKKDTLNARVTVPAEPNGELLVDVRTGGMNLQFVDGDGKPAGPTCLRLRFSRFEPARQFETDGGGKLQVTLGEGRYQLSVLPKRLATREARQQLILAEGYQELQSAWLPLTEIVVAGKPAAARTITLPPEWQR